MLDLKYKSGKSAHRTMRTYTRKTNRGQVPQEIMLTAACEVIERGRKLRQIAKELNICHATLFRFVKKLKSGENPTVGYKSRRFFTETQEKGIANYLMGYARIFFGLTIDEARRLAFQCAIRLKYPNVSSGWVKNGTAGREWIDNFLLRHPQIRIRSQKTTTAQSKHNINEFFSMLFKLLQEYKFLPSKIYHLVDFSVTPILKYRNMANGPVSVSVGRGKPVNMQLAANASGETIPPMFVLPITDHKPRDGPEGLIIGNDSGQMTAKDFLTYIDHFTLYAKPTPTDPVLLLLQNNCQYHINVNILEKAKENSIILLSYPPYSKYECCIQPLEKIAPKFLRSCRMAQIEWLRAHPGKSVTPYKIPRIVGKVLPMERDIKKSFQKSGVWPFFNPSIIPTEEFVPYAVEDLVYYDLANDVENWMKFKFFGGKLFLKKHVIPHIFECQNRMMPMKPRSAGNKRKRREILESLADTAPTLESSLVRGTYDSQNQKISNDKSVQLNEPATQQGPSGKGPSAKVSSDPDGLEDPLAHTPVGQCCVCGEFNKDCVNVIDEDKPYIASNKTVIKLNDMSVELDFNDGPKTVCRICDRKLQVMFEFVKQVKEAQDSLINLRSDRKEIEYPGKMEVEILVVKTECESPIPDEIEDEDIKDEIVDSLTVTETEFVKRRVRRITNKRKKKSDKVIPNTKKPKVTKSVENENELILDIKEETAEIDEACEGAYLEFSVRETDVNNTGDSELELGTRPLASEMTNKDTLVNRID